MVCSMVEGMMGTMGRMKVRRQEMVAPLSDSWTDGRDADAFIACGVEADWMRSWSTGENDMEF
jgi:hypothetical protein